MEAKLVVGILLPTLSFICAGGFLFLWSLNRQLKYGLMLASTFLLVGSGAAINVVLEPHWPRFGNFVCGAFYMGAIASLTWAILARYKLPIPFKMTFAILLITNVANGLALGFLPDLEVSFGVVALAGGILCIMLSYRLWNIEPLTPFDKALPPALLAAGVLLTADPLLTLLFNTETLPIQGYADTTRWITLQMLVIVLCVVLAFSLSMLMIADILQDIQSKADIDSLTGISRRGPFENNVRKLLEKFEDTPLPFTLVICDIDKFKSINDTYGHLAGDEVIKRVASVLKSSVRESDYVARLGGEEFGILLWNCNMGTARMMAEQLRSNIESMRMPPELPQISCTASFGIAQHCHGEAYKSMFSRADKALYEAKDRGRNCVMQADRLRLVA